MLPSLTEWTLILLKTEIFCISGSLLFQHRVQPTPTSPRLELLGYDLFLVSQMGWFHCCKSAASFGYTSVQALLEHTQTSSSSSDSWIWKDLYPNTALKSLGNWSIYTKNIKTIRLIASSFLQTLCLLLQNISLSVSHLSQQHQK